MEFSKEPLFCLETGVTWTENMGLKHTHYELGQGWPWRTKPKVVCVEKIS